MKLARFEFTRKKTGQKYMALQFAESVVTTGIKGKTKGKPITRRDSTKFFALTEREIDALLKENEIDSKVAKILGANVILRKRAAGSGMVDVIIAKLQEKNVLIPNVTDPEKIASGRRAIATSILTLFRDRQRMGKPWDLDKCFSVVCD
jgi:hypothetical protein